MHERSPPKVGDVDAGGDAMILSAKRLSFCVCCTNEGAGATLPTSCRQSRDHTSRRANSRFQFDGGDTALHRRRCRNAFRHSESSISSRQRAARQFATAAAAPDQG